MTDIGRPIAPWVALLGALCALAAAVSCGESDDPIGAIRELHANRRYAESLEPLRALLDENPDQPEVNLLLGEALMRTGDSSSAIWPLRRALESPDHVVEAGLLLGQAELASRTPRDVLNAVEPVLEVEPENVEALVIRAQGYLKANRHEEALADIVRVAEIDPGNLNVLVPRVLALIELERIDEAEQALSPRPIGSWASRSGAASAWPTRCSRSRRETRSARASSTPNVWRPTLRTGS
jgi:Flp pilus assembly protein TadD